MSIINATVERFTNTHIMGTARLNCGKVEEDVLFVAPMPANFVRHQPPELDNSARYYSSPLVARTAFDDLSSGVVQVPAFEGRDLSTMQTHLARQAK